MDHQLYFLYVDASGDPGASRGASERYILTGVVVPTETWESIYHNYVLLRRYLKREYGFPVRAELKGRWLVWPKDADQPTIYKAIGNRQRRFAMYDDIMTSLPAILRNSAVLNTHADKINRPSSLSHYEERSWERLANRFHQLLKSAADGSKGMIIADNNDNHAVRGLFRKIRVYNPIPSKYKSGSYNNPLRLIVEDPVFRESAESHFLQVCDLISYSLLMMKKKAFRKYSGDKLFLRLRPILATKASPDEFGVIEV